MKAMHWLTMATGLALAAAPAFSQQQVSDQEQKLIEQMRQAAKGQGITLTPEMAQQMLKRYREVNANMMGLQMVLKSRQQSPEAPTSPPKPVVDIPQPAAAQPTAASVSPEGLASALLPHRQAQRATTFEDARDGFKANGQLWMDPTGAIETYGVDAATGDATYLVDMGGNRYAVKHANVNASAAPVELGTIQIGDDRVSFASVDGTQLGGESFVVMSDGVLITRAGSMFRYIPGQRPAAQTVPTGYAVLYAQGGDVASTGYVLAMKRGKPSWADAIGVRPGQPSNTWRRSNTHGLFGVSADRVGLKKPAMFGSREPDFALIDIKTGRSVVVPRSELTTDIGWADRQGNKQHFVNAIKWFPTSIGPIAVVYGDNNASIYAIHLPSGRQELLFNRPMGINSWRAEPTPDGGIRVGAKLGLGSDEIPDVRVKFSGTDAGQSDGL